MSVSKFNPAGQTCFHCGSKMLKRFQAVASDSSDQANVSIVECQSCIVAWQYPLARNNEESVKHFEFSYQDKGRTASTYFDPAYKKTVALTELDFINRLSVGARTLLDIGAGAGIFGQAAAEHGWNVTAVDPALDIESISQADNLRLFKGTVDDLPIDELFDVVTLWDVIEHVTEPMEFIANAKERVRSGGWLVVETGNYKSAGRVMGGLQHWIYQLDHRWYFSPGSMRHMMQQLGFANFVLSERVLRPHWKGRIDFQGPTLRSLFSSLLHDPLNAASSLSRHRDLLSAKAWEMGGIEIFTIAAQKVT